MKVIYEDNEILVLEKPIGVPSEDTKNGEKGILTKINEEIYAGQIHLLHRHLYNHLQNTVHNLPL